jgi:CRISPR-associated endonuclease/helicase Cas3
LFSGEDRALNGKPTDFWAKLQRDDEGRPIHWHPLSAHCADVAAVAEGLLADTVLRSRLGRLLGQTELSETQVGRLCVLTALHDVGKVNHGFQDLALDPATPRVGHVSPLVDFMKADGRAKNEIVEALGLQEMLAWFASQRELVAFLLATFGHHGRPVAPSHRFRPDLWRSGRCRPSCSTGRIGRWLRNA